MRTAVAAHMMPRPLCRKFCETGSCETISLRQYRGSDRQPDRGRQGVGRWRDTIVGAE